MKWWLHRILFFRWLTGCRGEGFIVAENSIENCEKTGCH